MTPRVASLEDDTLWTPLHHLRDIDDTVDEQELGQPDEYSPVKILDNCLVKLSDVFGKPRIEPLQVQVESLGECKKIERLNIIKKTEQACHLICDHM